MPVWLDAEIEISASNRDAAFNSWTTHLTDTALKPMPVRLTSIGPLPPPLGGATVLFDDYASKITSRVGTHRVVNTTNFRSGILRWIWEGRIAAQVVAAPFRSDIVALHASIDRALVYGAVLYLLSLITRARVIVRCFGGGLDIKLLAAPFYFKWLEKLTLRNSLVLLETKHLCRWASERHPRARVDWHPNCREMPDKVDSNYDNVTRFVFLGKVCADKGVDTILKMRERWPEDPFTIEVIGPLDGTISEERLQNAAGVEYLGVMSHAAAEDRLRDCQALVLPTRYSGEGYPGVILEAYAQGTPVIATRWRAIPEIVADGETGLLIDVDSEGQLRQAMLRMTRDREYVTNMRVNARKLSNRFSSHEWHGTKWTDWIVLVLDG